METIDITDIEDLVLSKHEIDLALINSGAQTERMGLEYYIANYCDLSKSSIVKGQEMLPFSLMCVAGKYYLYVSHKNNSLLGSLKNIIIGANYDLSSLEEVSLEEYSKEQNIDDEYIINNNKWYKACRTT